MRIIAVRVCMGSRGVGTANECVLRSRADTAAAASVGWYRAQGWEIIRHYVISNNKCYNVGIGTFVIQGGFFIGRYLVERMPAQYILFSLSDSQTQMETLSPKIFSFFFL